MGATDRALILEDDYDGEYRYGDRPIPASGLDQNHSVLPRHFSKVLFPALRLVIWYYPNLVALFAQAKWLNDRQLPTLEQQVLTDISEGYFKSHSQNAITLRSMPSGVGARINRSLALVLPFFGEGRHSFDGACILNLAMRRLTRAAKVGLV